MTDRTDTANRFTPINGSSGKQDTEKNECSDESATYDMDRTKLSITDYKNKLIIQIKYNIQ